MWDLYNQRPACTQLVFYSSNVREEGESVYDSVSIVTQELGANSWTFPLRFTWIMVYLHPVTINRYSAKMKVPETMYVQRTIYLKKCFYFYSFFVTNKLYILLHVFRRENGKDVTFAAFYFVFKVWIE